MESATSFRDPAGCCCLIGDRVLRWISADHAPAFEAFLATPTAQQFIAGRQLVSVRKLPPAERESLKGLAGLPDVFAATGNGEVFEHERVEFPSYPCEWPAEMLHAAGQLTLNLARTTLADGHGLKDATPDNVLFRGTQPVFVDLLSFEKRATGDPVWKPYAQFVRMFLLPLLVHQRWGLPLADLFVAHRNGLEPEAVYRLCGPLRRLFPPFLEWVSLPTWLSRRGEDHAAHRERRVDNPEKAGFILEMTLKRLERALEKVRPRRNATSTWSDYMDTHSYT